jgi:hypothetical protein
MFIVDTPVQVYPQPADADKALNAWTRMIHAPWEHWAIMPAGLAAQLHDDLLVSGHLHLVIDGPPDLDLTMLGDLRYRAEAIVDNPSVYGLVSHTDGGWRCLWGAAATEGGEYGMVAEFTSDAWAQAFREVQSRLIAQVRRAAAVGG